MGEGPSEGWSGSDGCRFSKGQGDRKFSHLLREASTSAQNLLPDLPTWYSSKSSQCIWYLKQCPMLTPPFSLPAVEPQPQGLTSCTPSDRLPW